ncbi:hypothetical protein [Bacillus sp. FJAT-28004]|uniref:hypothetical protein n=1 Tax=Bacillus sp. FJAT-28004 TaxID=1679165 RepID=UPI0006B5BF85|nr:hypothetical protein [Bacillus sp. FJAT-28004]
MKAYILSDLPGIMDAFSDLNEVESTERFILGEHQIFKDNSIIVVSEQYADVKMIIQLREENPNAKIFYHVTMYADASEAKAIQSTLIAYDTRVIPPYSTGKQIADFVAAELFSKTKGISRVVTALGSLYGVGVTSSLILLGKQIVDMSNIRVAIIGLNGFNPGTNCIEYNGKYLDEIWGLLDGKQMQPADLEEKMVELHDGLFYLAGNRDVLKVYTYTPEGIAHLIDLAKQRFDLVILDAGHHMDTPLAVQAILSSDLKLVYTNQRTAAREAWSRYKDQVLERELGLDVEHAKNIWLVCNMMYPTSDLETTKHLSEVYKLPSMANIPYYNTFYRFEFRKDLLSFNEKKYVAEINRIVNGLVDFYQLPLKDNGRKTKGWFAQRGS